MNIVFVAPLSLRRKALAAETRRAADDGHHVLLIAEGGARWESDPLDDRIGTRWIDAGEVRVAEGRMASLAGRRVPLGLLRRIGRGPLRRPAKGVERRWRRKVVKRLDARLKERTDELRQRRRVERIRAAIAESGADWIVLHEPAAIELGVDYLPAILDAKPELITSFSYEEFLTEPRAEVAAAHGS